MTMIAALMLAVLIEPQGRAAAPQAVTQEVPRTPPATELRVVLATPVYEPNGSVGVETTMVENGGTSILHLFARKSVCEVAKSSKDEPRDASVGWRVTTHTISQSPTEIVVSVDWRRMWDRGKKISDGPAATQQLVLHPGDSIPLDHIPNLQASGECRAVGLGLEVRTVRVTVAPTAPPQNPALPLGAQPGGTSALDADLWLVHKKPSGVPEVVHQTVHLPLTGGPFAFSTVKFPTANGEIGVELTGTFRRFQTPTSGEYVFMSMTRVITGGSAPSGGLSQSTSAPLALPGPLEVLSFEMPSGGAGARGRGGAGAGGAEQLRSGGVVAGGVGGIVMSPRSVAAGSGGATAQAGGTGGGGGTGGARGGGGGGRGGAVGSPAATSQRVTMAAMAAAILEGHEFSLRVQLTPVK
jgi:guanyl-specific ribonuclease Sa